jgi:hypothetical protein
MASLHGLAARLKAKAQHFEVLVCAWPAACLAHPNGTCLPGCLPAQLIGYTACPACLQYTYALFRSSSGMLACGWGTSIPASLEELWLMLMLQWVGSFMQLVFQAAILTLVRTYDRSTSNYMQRMEMVKVGGAGRGGAGRCLLVC